MLKLTFSLKLTPISLIFQENHKVYENVLTFHKNAPIIQKIFASMHFEEKLMDKVENLRKNRKNRLASGPQPIF